MTLARGGTASDQISREVTTAASPAVRTSDAGILRFPAPAGTARETAASAAYVAASNTGARYGFATAHGRIKISTSPITTAKAAGARSRTIAVMRARTPRCLAPGG